MEELFRWVSRRARVLLTDRWSVHKPEGLWDQSWARQAQACSFYLTFVSPCTLATKTNKRKIKIITFWATQWKLFQTHAPSNLCALEKIDPPPRICMGPCKEREAAQERDQGQRIWRDEESQELFKDHLCYHIMEWQAFSSLKGKQLPAFHHGGLSVSSCRSAGERCLIMLQKRSVTFQQEKSPVAKTRNEEPNPVDRIHFLWKQTRNSHLIAPFFGDCFSFKWNPEAGGDCT